MADVVRTPAIQNTRFFPDESLEVWLRAIEINLAAPGSDIASLLARKARIEAEIARRSTPVE